MIIVVYGLPGSGKSYFAERLANRLDAKYVSSDMIRKLHTSHPDYSVNDKYAVYAEMIESMRRDCALSDVVLDATFYLAQVRKELIDEANKSDQQIAFIEVWAEEALISSRLAQKRKYSDADFSVYKRIKSDFEPYNGPRLRLQSTNDNINEMLDKAISYLQSLKP